MVGTGLGVACPKSWRSGCEPATLETVPFPICPPGAGRLGFALGVGHQVGEDGIAYAPFQAAQRFFVGLALLDLAVVIGPAFAVAETDLGDRRHVHGVVEPDLELAP